MVNSTNSGEMNGPSMRPPGKPDSASHQPILPPQNGSSIPQRTLHPPPGLYPISQMQEMYNASSQYQYAPPVAHMHNAAHLTPMGPPPAHLLGTHGSMGPIQAMHAMTVPPTHFQIPTQNLSAANETTKPSSTKPVPDPITGPSEPVGIHEAAAEPPKEEIKTSDIPITPAVSVDSLPKEEVKVPETKVEEGNEVKVEVKNGDANKPSEPVPAPELSVEKDEVLTKADSTTEPSSKENMTNAEPAKQEEATSTSTEIPSESAIVATKSAPPAAVTTTAVTPTEPITAEETKEAHVVSESVKEPETASVLDAASPKKVEVKPPSPKKPQTKTKAEKKSEPPPQVKATVTPKKVEKTVSSTKESAKTDSGKSSPPKRKRDESNKRGGAAEKSDTSSGDERKSKRARTQTMPFQAALEDLTYLRMVKKLSQPVKVPEEKVVIFLKNEFLAVRNPEGSFYVCRALQDVIRSSHNIKICWMTNEKQTEKDLYVKDYSDKTDFECILTNLALEKVDKDTFRLPAAEAQRTDNILKRALDKEKGVMETSITEDNPDGIDVSLIKDGTNVRRRTRSTGPTDASDEEAAESSNSDVDEESPPETPKKKSPSRKKTQTKKTPAKTPAKTAPAAVASTPKASAVKPKRGAVATPSEESSSKASSSEGRRASKRARPSAVELPPLTDDEFEELIGDSPDDNDSDSEGEKKKKKKKSKKKKSKEEKAAKKAEKKQKKGEAKEKGSSKSAEKDEEESPPVLEEEPPAKKAKETKKTKKSKK